MSFSAWIQFLRSLKIKCNHLQDIRVRFGRVIETRSVDESDPLAKELECFRRVDGTRTRSEAVANGQPRSRNRVYELGVLLVYGLVVNALPLTVDFPEPVGPITLHHGVNIIYWFEHSVNTYAMAISSS